MNLLLIIIIFILVIVIFIQGKIHKKTINNLNYIEGRLKNIVENKANEKILLLTDEKEIINLLIQINNVLDYSKSAINKYNRSQISIKKMLSNVSHDLKTPLTVILGYIETIKLDNNMSQDHRQILLSRVHNKTLEVLELINKFFDLAKLEAGDNHISLTKINLNEICKKNILSFYDILTNNKFEVCINIPKKNVYAIGNEEAMDRILNNLISNAIKYGGCGKIIGLDLRYDDNYVYVDIWDKGKGISEHNKDRVFERMYTLDDSRNKLNQGSGLGLTITKRLVEKLNGNIYLDSIPYKKTTFCVKLKKMNY